jgi:hypothetical protein
VTRAFSDETLERLGLGSLQKSYDKAVARAEARHNRQGDEGWTSPMAVVRYGSLSLDGKRAILIDWAWTEYLIDQAIREGGPEIGRLRAFRRSSLPCGLSNVTTLRQEANTCAITDFKSSPRKGF